MKCRVPKELPVNPWKAYEQGWNDRAAAGARKAGRTMTDARREANKRNAKLPRKRKIVENAT